MFVYDYDVYSMIDTFKIQFTLIKSHVDNNIFLFQR